MRLLQHSAPMRFNLNISFLSVLGCGTRPVRLLRLLMRIILDAIQILCSFTQRARPQARPQHQLSLGGWVLAILGCCSCSTPRCTPQHAHHAGFESAHGLSTPPKPLCIKHDSTSGNNLSSSSSSSSSNCYQNPAALCLHSYLHPSVADRRTPATSREEPTDGAPDNLVCHLTSRVSGTSAMVVSCDGVPPVVLRSVDRARLRSCEQGCTAVDRTATMKLVGRFMVVCQSPRTGPCVAGVFPSSVWLG
jgi:hypothetical protein